MLAAGGPLGCQSAQAASPRQRQRAATAGSCLLSAPAHDPPERVRLQIDFPRDPRDAQRKSSDTLAAARCAAGAMTHGGCQMVRGSNGGEAHTRWLEERPSWVRPRAASCTNHAPSRPPSAPQTHRAEPPHHLLSESAASSPRAPDCPRAAQPSTAGPALRSPCAPAIGYHSAGAPPSH